MEITHMDQRTACTHLAKVFAFLACGKIDRAREHAAQLVAFLSSL